jgi:hypothetical protein
MWDRTKAADGRLSNCGMNIGDLVLHEGRRYYLRGLDPMSVPDRQAFLEDAFTGEARMVPVDRSSPRRRANGGLCAEFERVP